MDRERSALAGFVRAPALSAEAALALREAWHATWTSRLVVWATGVLAVLSFGRAPGTTVYDPARLTEPFGGLGNLLVAPAARWDSVWYLTIAQGGYGGAGDRPRTAFFPLYPLLVHAGGWIVGAPMVAGLLVSLACFLAALVLLQRLAAIELGPAAAHGTVMLVAFFPVAFFFSAVYSESLFLLLSVATLLAARQGRWAWAGVLGALAAATRNGGVLLVLPIALLFLYGPRGDRPSPASPAGRSRWRPRHRVEPALLWAGLVPLGLGAYLLYLGLATGDALATFHAPSAWLRHFSGPFAGAWDGARAAWDGLRQLAHGSRTPVYFRAAGGDPFRAAGMNLMLFGFLVAGLIALAGALRRLPIAYGAYAGVAFVLAISYPVDAQPLMSLPRYLAVLFPLQMWLASWAVQRRCLDRVLAGSAVLLGLFTAQFATWIFVA
jgi:Mannosyltransferase (PIG-V)